ncbi:photosynthetic complex assembly protein 2 [Thiohalocapsa halophila]|uniref:Photosynthetic complex assembly protein 2 n=1 Tax=Thiohalocapsa halophila TaxID=69359 RepID=A0ABS1CI22_9GAMM|nr:putative photosynthetic complex assembly protein PuhE [Thiohalocapsa halophila]MBK1631567.1 photosynthetic complex assembly protein 2 [Thiohalocapsa halophila]
MLSYGLAVAYALFLWWFSTGVILYLDKRPEHTYPWSLAGATLALVAAFGVLVWSRDLVTVLGAYAGFTAGVVIWGWMEMSYFMGFITGPRKSPCPEGCRGWQRFRLALSTSIYHELVIVAAASLMIWLTWGAVNTVGTWTFVILWLMRWSAKLNLFLGVPNLNEDWLPERIRFLTTYLAKRPMNLLFPVSVSVATVIMCLLVDTAVELPAGSFAGVALILAATLLALAILEHWFLVLPLADGALWRWALEPEVDTAMDAGTSTRGPQEALSAAGSRQPVAAARSSTQRMVTPPTGSVRALPFAPRGR